MSSKSRKHSNKPSHQPKEPGHGAQHGKAVEGEVEFAEPTEKDFLEDDLKTPKGRNPITYAFMILLLVFLTVIFILPPTAGQGGGGGGGDEVAVQWNDPQLGPRVLTVNDQYDARRRFEGTLEMGGAFAITSLLQQGFITNPRRLSDEDLVRLVMADQQAQAAGIHISDEEHVAAIRTIVSQVFGDSVEQYSATLRSRAQLGGVKGYEDAVRRLLRIQRYVELCAMAASVPSREAIETAWHDSHQEYRFEWAAATIADFEEAARAEEPTDEDLERFMNGLTAFQMNDYRRPATYAAELVGVLKATDEPRSLEKLELAYPRPDDWDDEAEADQFYKNYYFTIYKRPQPEESEQDDSGESESGESESGESEAGEGEESDEEEVPLYWTFDEAKEWAIRDARAAAALEDWRSALDARIAEGQEVDLAAEAELLGLDYVAVTEPLDPTGWRELGGLSNNQVASRVRSMTEPGQLSSLAIVGESGVTIVRLTERNEAFLPPVAELRDELLEPYVEARTIELAEEALDALRDGLLANDTSEDTTEDTGEESTDDEPATEPATTVDSATFTAAAEAAGLTLGVRDWLDRRAVEADDPNWDDEVHMLVRSTAPLFSLEEGGLSVPLRPTGELERIYLVRAAGQRPVDFDRITAKDFNSLRGAAQFEALRTFYEEGPFSDIALRERYGLRLPLEEQREAERAAEEADSQEG